MLARQVGVVCALALLAVAGCGGGSHAQRTWQEKVLGAVCADKRRTIETAAQPDRRGFGEDLAQTRCRDVEELVGVLRASGYYRRTSAWLFLRARVHGERWLNVQPRSFPGIDWPRVPAAPLPAFIRDELREQRRRLAEKRFFARNPLLRELCGKRVWSSLPLELGSPEGGKGTRALATIPAGPDCRRAGVRVVGRARLSEDYANLVRVTVRRPAVAGWVHIGLVETGVEHRIRRLRVIELPPRDRSGSVDLTTELIREPLSGDPCPAVYVVRIANAGDAATPTARVRLAYHGSLDILRPLEPREFVEYAYDLDEFEHGRDAAEIVDPRNEIPESDETNNRVVLPYREFICVPG